MKLRARAKVWLEDEAGAYLMGPRTARLLRTIEHTGSLSGAAVNAGFSYRAAWNRLQRIEEALGEALVETRVGGPDGGGTTLSATGRALLEVFVTLEGEVERLLEAQRDL